MKFAMEDQTLVRLGQRTQTESEDLATLVHSLVEAAEPLEGVFNGQAKARFNSFKVKTDEIGTALNNALAGIVGSIGEQNLAFTTANEEGASAHESAEGSADFSSESLLHRISGHSGAGA